MAIDQPRRRKGITGETRDRKKETDKRLSEGEKVVKDKETQAECVRKLSRAGTSEGTAQTDRSIKRAAEVTDKEHAKKEHKLKEHFQGAKKLEQDLNKRSGAVAKDTAELARAAGKIDTGPARAQVQEGVKAAKEDKTFLDKSKKTQEGQRRGGEKKLDNQKRRLKAAKVEPRR